jgi:hypothetical protein
MRLSLLLRHLLLALLLGFAQQMAVVHAFEHDHSDHAHGTAAAEPCCLALHALDHAAGSATPPRVGECAARAAHPPPAILPPTPARFAAFLARAPPKA